MKETAIPEALGAESFDLEARALDGELARVEPHQRSGIAQDEIDVDGSRERLVGGDDARYNRRSIGPDHLRGAGDGVRAAQRVTDAQNGLYSYADKLAAMVTLFTSTTLTVFIPGARFTKMRTRRFLRS